MGGELDIWLARDIFGNLWGFYTKPHCYQSRKGEQQWRNQWGDASCINFGLDKFKFIKAGGLPVKAKLIVEV